MRAKYGDVLFFSDFDSGNLDKVEEVVGSNNEQTLCNTNCNNANFKMPWGIRTRLKTENVTFDMQKENPTTKSPSTYKNILELSTGEQSDSDSQNSAECSQFDVSSPPRPSSSKSEGHLLNLRSLEYSRTSTNVLKEFRVWTRLDCSGTPYENVYRTWFYFGVQSTQTNVLLRIHVMNLNKQNKLMCQGMSPVYKVVPGKETWQRIPNKPAYLELDGQMILTFEHPLPDELSCVTYFAFTYPFSYEECQSMISEIDKQHQNCLNLDKERRTSSNIYYARQLLCNSPNGLRVDLLTVTSTKGMLTEREDRLPHIFPDALQPMCHKFLKKKVVFVSARVHPGETQSSYVINGCINFVLDKTNPQSQILRDNFVFKFLPMLNPDGVYCGHYRTDLRGENLNRVYLNCDPMLHPTVFAARSLLIYYHYCYSTVDLSFRPSDLVKLFNDSLPYDACKIKPAKTRSVPNESNEAKSPEGPWNEPHYRLAPTESGIAYYLDLHGHAAKRGCFIFGNNFNNINEKVECMLLAKLMSLNFSHFDFAACNFSTQNMIHKGARDGLSKEGSGRVALFFLTRIIHSYTFEVNFNTGRTVNFVVPNKSKNGAFYWPPLKVPPKYTPETFEEAGAALAVSILDAMGNNSLSMRPGLELVKSWLKQYINGNKLARTPIRQPARDRADSENNSKNVKHSKKKKSCESPRLSSPVFRIDSGGNKIRAPSSKNNSACPQRKLNATVNKLLAVKRIGQPSNISVSVSQPGDICDNMCLSQRKSSGSRNREAKVPPPYSRCPELIKNTTARKLLLNSGEIKITTNSKQNREPNRLSSLFVLGKVCSQFSVGSKNFKPVKK